MTTIIVFAIIALGLWALWSNVGRSDEEDCCDLPSVKVDPVATPKKRVVKKAVKKSTKKVAKKVTKKTK